MSRIVAGWKCIGAIVALAPCVGAQSALWTRSDNGAGWVGRSVSLGAQGTQVFTEFEFGQDHAELLSGFDQNPATPVWQNAVPVEAANTTVDSADMADVHVSMHQIVLNNSNATKQSVVSKYSSDSSTPDWTYTFPTITGAGARVAVSDDGQRIIAVSLASLTARLQIAVFQPNSGTPVYTGEILNFGLSLVGCDLSADGSTLYLTSQTGVILWNTNTHSVAWQILVAGALDCQGVSGNGAVYALGGFNFMDVWERNPSGSYSKTYTKNMPGSWLCGKIDVSTDGSTIAYAFNGYGENNDHVRIQCLDVATKLTTMSDEAIGTGTFQNVCSDIAISRDGSRFVAGLWGDEGNICPEVRLYRRNQSTPWSLYNLTGSVFDVDISGDGERVAAASKAVHANQYAGGGSISYYAFEAQDLRATGSPVLGSTMHFDLGGPPHSPARLLFSHAAGVTPTVFGNIGTLYLDRSDLSSIAVPATDATGRTSFDYTLPGSASQIGQSLFFQGFFTIPRRLTSDWVRVTILP